MRNMAATLAAMQGQRVYFDVNVLIYVLNNTPVLADVSLAFWEAVQNGHMEGCTGELGLAELLVKPMQTNDLAAADVVRSLFDERGFFTLLAHTRAMFELAAQLRGTQKLKMPDAIHTATAIESGCAFMLTYDLALAQRSHGVGSGMEVIHIRDFLPTAVD